MAWSIVITPRGNQHRDVPAICAAVSTSDLQIRYPADVIEGGLISLQHPQILTTAGTAPIPNLAKAVHDMHRADQDARRAAQIERAIRGDLAAVAARLPNPGPVGHPDKKGAEAVRTAMQAQGGRPGSPVPNRVESARERTPAGPRRGAGSERDQGIER